MTQVKDWLSEEEAAKWLAIPIEAIRQAISQGGLPVLRIGGFTRVSSVALLELARASGSQLKQVATVDVGPTRGNPDANATAATALAVSAHDMRGGVPLPLGLEWIDDLHSIEAFTYHWPSGETVRYEPSHEGRITLYGQAIRVRIGQYNSVNRDTRSRMAVLFDGTPICEFVETAVGSGWASLIKPDGKSVLRATDPVPSLYMNSQVRPYREATGIPAGPGVSTGQCVVFAQDDLRSAVHHAAARWLGKNQRPLEPQS